MNKKLEETLEVCLADIKEGRATLDQCLSRYAAQAVDLEPLLRASISLRKISLPQPAAKRVSASRQRVLQDFRAPVPLAWWRRAFTAPALAFSAVFTFFLLTILGAGALLAASNRGPLLANAYPNPSSNPSSQPQVPPTAEPKIAFNGIGLPDQTGPYEIASAPDGTLWFVQTDTAQVGSLDANGSIKDWPTASKAGAASGIAVDSAGKVWFTVSSSHSIIALDPKADQISSWRVPTEAGAGALGRIAAGKDGRIWFIAKDGTRIYELDSKTDEFTDYEVDGARYLEWANDTLWFSGIAGKLGQISAEGQVQLLDVPGTPAAMVWDGVSLWYAGGALLGQVDAASGKVKPYALENSTIDRIATDGQQNIWFGSQGGTQLGILQTQSGQISTRSLDSMVQNLYSLAVGTNKVWMSDSVGSTIYAFSLANPLSLQTERFMAALSFPSLP